MRALPLLFLLGLLAAPAGAAGPALPPFGLGDFDRSEPITITADQLEARDADGRRTLAFRDHVQVRQGPLALSASLLSAEYVRGEEQPRRLEAHGDVRIREGARRARCASAVYDRLAQRIVCRGGPAELEDGDDRLAGDEIVFDLARHSVRVDGATRVEIHRALDEAGLELGEELGDEEREAVQERLREGGAVTIDARALEASDPGAERRIHFEGDVRLRQGEIELHAGELLALYPAEAVRPERLIATRDVVLREGAREARCERAEYTLAAQRIECTGGAVLRDGRDRLEGEHIAFDFGSRRVDAVGGARLLVQPRPAAEDPR